VKVRALFAFVLALGAGSAVGVRLHAKSAAHAARPEQPALVVDPPQAPAAVDDALVDPSRFDRRDLTTERARAWLLAEGPAIAPGDGRRLVTLTFDDGPFPETTPAVLKLLDKHQVKATFFIIGRYLEGNTGRDRAVRAAAREIDAAGHIIGSHTHDHALLTAVSHTQVLDQIDDGVASIERTLGHRPALFRPPFGQLDAFGEKAIAERHFGLVLWSVEAGDMKDRDEDEMFDKLTDQLDFAGGGLVLLHDAHWATVHVLARLLDWLDARRWDSSRPARPGFAIVDLPTYMREARERPQPYATRKELEEARAHAWRAAHPDQQI